MYGIKSAPEESGIDRIPRSELPIKPYRSWEEVEGDLKDLRNKLEKYVEEVKKTIPGERNSNEFTITIKPEYRGNIKPGNVDVLRSNYNAVRYKITASSLEGKESILEAMEEIPYSLKGDEAILTLYNQVKKGLEEINRILKKQNVEKRYGIDVL